LKVLRTIESFLPYICGPVNQAFQISNRLEKNGIPSPIYTTYLDVPPGLPKKEIFDKVTVNRFKSQLKIMRYLVSIGMLRYLKEFDILHSHNYRNFQTDSGFFFALIKNKPFILNTHGSLLGFKNYLSSRWQRFPYRLYDIFTLKASAKRAQAIVVSSKLEYEDALEFGIEKEKIHVIPMGIDVEETKKEQNSSEKLKILFVGRIARVRRVELLIQAVNQLKIPFHLTIAGGEEKTSSVTRIGYLNELKLLTKQLNLNNNITFTGKRNSAELKALYKSSNIFVYPSIYENFGQPLLEAAAHGLPLISTSVGIAKDIVVDGETGHKVTGNIKEIKDSIESLKDPSLRLEMGRKIQVKVKQMFDWNKIMDQYINLYQSLS